MRPSATPPCAVFVPHDATHEAHWAAVVKTPWFAFGRIDALVNNADVTGGSGPVEEWSAEDFRRLVDVNLTGSFLGLRAVVPVLRERGGSIVSVSSAARLTGLALTGGYGASKGGPGASPRSRPSSWSRPESGSTRSTWEWCTLR